MPTEPSNAEPPKRQRRFQFRLRTLLIVVTLLCVVGGYVASQARIVQERQSWLADKTTIWSYTTLDSAVFSCASEFQNAFASNCHIPIIRTRLGDKPIYSIEYDRNTPEKTQYELRRVFPEAVEIKAAQE
jgi:hypothetical protein